MQFGRTFRVAVNRLSHAGGRSHLTKKPFSSISALGTPASSNEAGTGMLIAATSGMLLLSLSSEAKTTYNHCQVPCGIFDDPAVVGELKQACTTIRKAIVQSKKLHISAVGADPLAMNQMVRWINTKEDHCNKIIKLVGDYCLCQRVKRPNFKSEADYLQALKIHHTTMQAAMKAKQTMDEAACDSLEHAVDDLAKMYLPHSKL